MLLASLDPASAILLRLIGGAIGLLVSVVLAGRLLLHPHEYLPGRRALAHWLPIAMAALAAGMLGRFDMGVAIIFGTSVMALSSVVGFIGMTSPIDEAPPAWRSVWVLAPMAAILVFASGLRGYIGPIEMVILVAQGGVFLWLWGSAETVEMVGDAHPTGSAGVDGMVGDAHPTGSPGAIPQHAGWVFEEATRPAHTPAPREAHPAGPGPAFVALAGLGIAALAGICAWLAVRGAVMFSQSQPHYPAVTIAGTFLGIALVIPMINPGVRLAQRNLAGEAVTAQIGIVLLNLCALLPALAGLYFALHRIPRLAVLRHIPVNSPEEMVFPNANWRIDALVVMILMLALPPVAMGVMRLSRHVAAILIFAYCLYLMAALVFGGHG